MALTHEERRLRAQAAAYAAHAKHGGRHMTAKARAAFDVKFIDQVDPDRKLDPVDRERRAQHARSAYYRSLALKSVTARRERSGRSS